MELILLKNNPFYILNLSTNASKSEVFKAADELSYKIGIDSAQDAFIKLGNINMRLISELNYLSINNINDIDNIINFIENYDNKIDSLKELFSNPNSNQNSKQIPVALNVAGSLSVLSNINILKDFLILNNSGAVPLDDESLKFIKDKLSSFIKRDNISDEIINTLNENRRSALLPLIDSNKEVDKFIKLLLEIV